MIIPPNKVINTRVGLYQKYLSLSRSPFSIINQLIKNNQIPSLNLIIDENITELSLETKLESFLDIIKGGSND